MEENVLKYLSEGLTRDLIFQKNQKLLKDVTLFDTFGDKFVKEVTIKFREQILGQSDLIFDEESQDNLTQNQKLVFLI